MASSLSQHLLPAPHLRSQLFWGSGEGISSPSLLPKGNNEFLPFLVSGCLPRAGFLTSVHNSAVSSFSKIIPAGFWVLLRPWSYIQLYTQGKRKTQNRSSAYGVTCLIWIDLLPEFPRTLNILALISVLIGQIMQLLWYGRINHEGILLYLEIVLIKTW